MTRTQTLGLTALASAIVISISLAAVTIAAQQTRDAMAAPKTGNGIITGVVISDDNDRKPIRRATVTLAAGALTMPQTTITDDSGRFAFTGLAAGNYTAVVTKAGWVTSYYGSKTAGKPPGIPIALLDGQRIANINVSLLHGSVLGGVVRRASGQVAVGVPVIAIPVQMLRDQRRTAMLGNGSATTDDRGEFRIFGLAPGDYLLSVQAGFTAGLFPGAGDTRQVTSEQLQYAEHSGRPAATQISAAAPMPPAPDPGPTVTYSTVYYPGTTDSTAAATITLGRGEERTGLNFVTPLVPTAVVTGVVIDGEGRPVQGVQIQMQGQRTTTVNTEADLVRTFLGSGGSRSGPDGTFTISSLTPGAYTVSARHTPRAAGAASRTPSPLDEIPAALMGMLGMQPAGVLWASENVSVNGRDVGGLVLRLQPGMTVTGKVVYQNTRLPQPTDYSRVRLSLAGLPNGAGMADLAASMMTGAFLTIAADGTFVAKGLVPGDYRLTVFGAGTMLNQLLPGSNDGWVLKSAMLNGRDVADVAFKLNPGEDVSGLVVTFTDQPTELTGTVMDQANRPTGAFPIIVFGTDRAYWTPASRRVMLVRPSTDGKFKTTGLPAGEYHVCAVVEADETTLYDPSFLEQLIPGAFKIVLGEGEKKVQDLKLGGG